MSRDRRVARYGDQLLRGVTVTSDLNSGVTLAMRLDGTQGITVLDTLLWKVELEEPVEPAAERPSFDEAVREYPKQILDAMGVIATYGAGQTAGAIEMMGGRTMMVEVTVHDVTGWEQER